MPEQIHRAVHVGAKANLGLFDVLAQLTGEVNDDVIVGDLSCLIGIKNVETGTAREIIRIEKSAHVSAKIAATACD